MSIFGFRRFLRRHLTKEQRRLIKFLVVGTSGVPVNLIAVYLTTTIVSARVFIGLQATLSEFSGIANLTTIGLRDMFAYLLGILVSILTNYLLNSAWTWGDRVEGDSSIRCFVRLAKFYLVSSIAAVVQLGTSSFVSAMVRGNELLAMRIHGDYRVYHVVAPLAGIIAGLAINFVVNNIWTFRKSGDGEGQG